MEGKIIIIYHNCKYKLESHLASCSITGLRVFVYFRQYWPVNMIFRDVFNLY